MAIRTATATGDRIIATPTSAAALYRVMTWLSPQFPVGSYTYSHGIEQAIAAGFIFNAVTVHAWIEDIVAHGAGRSDTVLLHHAHAAAISGDAHRLAATAQLAAALQPARR